MSEYLEYGGIEEDAKELRKKVADFFQTDYKVLYDALWETYQQGVEDTREQIAQEILDNPQLLDMLNIHNHAVGYVCPSCTKMAQAVADAAIARGQK